MSECLSEVMSVGKILRWGIAGCGSVAHVHALALKEIEDVRLIACFDKLGERARNFGSKFNIKWFDNLNDFLSEPLDVVSICTPSGVRKSIALESMKKGIHVITEKPMEATLEAIDEMIEAAKENHCVLGCIFQTRFGEAEQKLREVVDSGILGELVLAEADVLWFRSKDYYASSKWRGTWKFDGGGALMNQAIHTIDLMLWYMGPVKRVFGISKTLSHSIEVEDTAVAVLEFANGSLGNIKATTSVAPGFPRKLGIYGTKGSAELIGESLVVYGSKGTERKLLVKGETVATASNPAGFSHENHKRQFLDFIQAIQRGTRPKIDGYEGRKAVELIFSIYESSSKGIVVELQGASS